MQKVVTKIKEIFKNQMPDDSLIQVGSSVLGQNYNDIDFLVVTDDVVKTKENLIFIFINYKISLIDNAVKIINYFNKEISFALYDKNHLYSLIENYNSGKHVESEHKTWSIGYWLIEGFIKDLNNSRIIIDNHWIEEIKKITNKKCIYGEANIIKECNEEILIKKDMLVKCTNEIERKCLIDDISLAIIRAFCIINNTPLKGFKRLEQSINNLKKEYQIIINNIFENDNLDKAIKILNKYIANQNKLYMGTWQFCGNFKSYAEEEIINLLKYAKKQGITCYDTALVYGPAEKCVGKILNEDDIVLTKIPGKVKPPLYDDIALENCYSQEYMIDCLKKSLFNLDRKVIDILLLHNWNDLWNNSFELISWLIEIKKQGLVKKIGISIPNGYNKQLSPFVLTNIDVIEAPYNEEDNNIEKYIELYKKYNIEIILRSLFIQGKAIKNQKEKYEDIIKRAKKLDCSIVMGMTTEEQIKENVNKLLNK